MTTQQFHAPLALLFLLSATAMAFTQKPPDCTLLSSNWKNLACQVMSPGTLLGPAGSALAGKYIVNSPGFEPGIGGLAHRYGVSVGDNVKLDSTAALFPTTYPFVLSVADPRVRDHLLRPSSLELRDDSNRLNQGQNAYFVYP